MTENKNQTPSGEPAGFPQTPAGAAGLAPVAPPWARSGQARLLLALLPVGMAFIVQFLLWPLIDPYAWFLFYPAILTSAWIGGWPGGIAATTLATLSVWYCFIPHRFSFAIQEPRHIYPMVMFAGMGVLLSLVLERLRRTELLAANLYAGAPDGIFVADLDGRYTKVNDAACHMLGYTRGEIIGKPITDFLDPADVPRLRATREKQVAGGTENGLWRLRRKDGSYLLTEITANILPQGYWQAFVRDVQDREFMYAKLRQSASIFDKANEGILITDGRGMVIELNPAYTVLTGFDVQELRGADPHSHAFDLNSDALFKKIQEELEAVGSWRGEVWYRRKDGSNFAAWESVSTVRDKTGRLVNHVYFLSDTTERVRNAEELERLSREQQSLLDNELVGIATVRDRRIVWANTAYARILGYSDGELSGVSVRQLFPTQDAYVALAGAAYPLLESERSFRSEEEYVCKNGRHVWLNVSATTRNRDPGESLWAIVDVTARKLAEQALQASEQRYKGFLEDQTELICRFNADSTVQYVNDAFCKFFGVVQESIVGHPWQPVAHPDDLPRIHQGLRSLSRDNPLVMIENRVLAAGGEVRWAQFVNRAIYDDRGELLEIQAVGRDITDRKCAEQAADDLLKRLTSIASQIPGVIYQFRLRPDGTSCFPYTSDAVRQIYNVSPDDIRHDASPIFSKIHADDRESVLASIRQSAERLEPWHHEFRIYGSDESPHWLEGNATPQKEADGCILWHGYVGDVTERKLIEQALQRESATNKAILANVGDGIHVLDEDARIVEVGESFCTALGYSRHEMIGMHISQWDCGCGSPEAMMNVFHRQFTQQRISLFETRHRRKDGSAFDVEVSSCPFQLEGRWVLFNSSRDVTARRQTQAEHDRVRKIIELAPDFIAMTDMQAHLTYLNPAGARLLGLPEDVDLSPLEIKDLHPEWATQKVLEEGIPEVLERGFWYGETALRHRDGHEIPVQQMLVVHRDEAGTPQHMSTVMRDISERKRLDDQLKELNRDFEVFLANTTDFVYFKDEQSRIRFCSQSMADVTGFADWHEMIGKHDMEIFPEETAKIYYEEELSIFNQGVPLLNKTDPYFDAGGNKRWVSTFKWPLFDRENPNKVTGLFGISRDITAQKKIEDALVESENRFRTMANSAPVLIWISGLDKLCNWFNQVWLDFTGRSMDQEMGNGWAEGVHPDDFQRCLDIYVTSFDARKPFSMDYRLRRHDGEYRWITDNGVPRHDEDGDFVGYIGSCIDVTDRHRLEEQAQHMALYDPLTSLPNRRVLEDRLTQVMAGSKRTACYCALMFLDLDNFKPLNDTYGHVAGDLLLIQVAERLKECLRQVDTVARVGGDEFVILLGELDRDKARSAAQAAIVAEKIRTRISMPYNVTIQNECGTDVTVEHVCTASIGVTLFINHETSQADILKCADAAMYQAKDAGRNTIRFYAPDA